MWNEEEKNDKTEYNISSYFLKVSLIQIVPEMSGSQTKKGNASFWGNALVILQQLLEELLAPPTLAAVSFSKFSPYIQFHLCADY